jgi:hypothetical protein
MQQMTPQWVPTPEIGEVLELESGQHREVKDVIGSDYARVVQLRTAIKEGQQQGRPLYACSICSVPVSLLMHAQSGLFFFRHLVEDGRCSAVTRGELSREEIDARKYNGAKESLLHIRTKSWVADSLRADPNFSCIEIEARWKGAVTGTWRKPDVRAIYTRPLDGVKIPIAFEVQLSTTYLDVIVERRSFFRAEGGLLFWIFAEFKDDGRRLTQDDVFFNNNQNAFIVNSASASASSSSGQFELICMWSEPPPGSARLETKLVSFDDLTLDTAAQQAYYFDFYGRQRSIDEAAIKDTARLREQFEAAWLALTTGDGNFSEAWNKAHRQFRAVGIPLPPKSWDLRPQLLDALYSAKHGRPIGWRYKKFIEVAHRIAGAHPTFLQIFRKALHVYGRADQLTSEDQSGKWALRVKKYKAAIAAGDPSYAHDQEFDGLLAFLFPELF